MSLRINAPELVTRDSDAEARKHFRDGWQQPLPFTRLVQKPSDN